MSRNESDSATGELACKHGCGTTAGNAGALARHEQACDAKGASETGDAPDSAALLADDVEIREIANTLPNLRDADLRATCEAHDHTPADSDTLAEAAAKALIRAKGGGREAYVTVFGKCAEDGCEYGRNGWDTRKCKRHEAAGESAEPEDSGESGPEAAFDGVQIASELLADGVPAENAAEAVASMESADVPEAWADVAARLMDAGAKPAEATTVANTLRPDDAGE